MVTQKICHEVGIASEQMLLGRQIEAMSDEQLQVAAEHTTVFARLSPAHKQRIIKAYQSKGHTVGFMGDGINDAPSMRAADVGISVDTAVDIAKESANIILLEKSLLVLEEGVLEGRKVFANIVKYIRMGASSNFGNMFSVAGGEHLSAAHADGCPFKFLRIISYTIFRRCRFRRTTWTRSRSPRHAHGRWAGSPASSCSSGRAARCSITRRFS